MAIQLYVFAQQPPTSNGTICPVQADSIEQAVREAQTILGVTLTRKGGGNYTDSTGRNFFLYFGEKGMEQFGQLFDRGIHEIPATPAKATPKFKLGQMVATPGALRAIEEAEEVSFTFIYRHQCGDFGELDKGDVKIQNAALKHEGDEDRQERMMSSFTLPKSGVKIWVITEADRSSTCVLLPDEY